jgi:hypothetical protein
MDHILSFLFAFAVSGSAGALLNLTGAGESLFGYALCYLLHSAIIYWANRHRETALNAPHKHPLISLVPVINLIYWTYLLVRPEERSPA